MRGIFIIVVLVLTTTRLGWNATVSGLEAAVDIDSLILEERIFTQDREVPLEQDDDGGVGNGGATATVERPLLETDPFLQQQPTSSPQTDNQVEPRSASSVVVVDDDKILDEQTYLDLFGEWAKEFLTQKLIPTSDPECQWNWKHGRCEPSCLCDFEPKRGDFHLGRACRRRKLPVAAAAEEEMECIEDDASSSSLLRFLPTPLIQHMIHDMKERSKQVQSRVATEWDKVMDSVQLQVCQDVREQCSTDAAAAVGALSEDRVFAWQERLFCKDIIDDCSTASPPSDVHSTP